jgi:high-affinity Fe2+/Pb2+ permease
VTPWLLFLYVLAVACGLVVSAFVAALLFFVVMKIGDRL